MFEPPVLAEVVEAAALLLPAEVPDVADGEGPHLPGGQSAQPHPALGEGRGPALLADPTHDAVLLLTSPHADGGGSG
ncbi:MAG TPA: hypothetical protein VN648_07760 [Candidatus Methylomirabilis sp.]|nr:hypothetical protein [Candidatus Methylomirabilis sp.]